MMYPRFRVATCAGYVIHASGTQRRGGQAEPGLSATVCDTFYGWRAIRTYRSEDQVVRNGETVRRGSAGARQDAAQHADYLNEVYKRELATERQRARRERLADVG
jgi:hypothetical protein